MIEPQPGVAWRDLEDKLRPFIARRVADAADVDDVLQDVFIRLQRGLPTLRDDERFGPFVYQVARSAIVDHHRRAAKHRPAGGALDLEQTPAPEGGDDDDRALEERLASVVVVFVAALPQPYRDALTLTELQGLTQKQAAEMLGLSLSGMKSRVQRGRLLLRRALEDCCHIALDVRGRIVGCAPRPDGVLPSPCDTSCGDEPESP
jgi:RNA polymerase sigma-70 factor, ECF subfamily